MRILLLLFLCVKTSAGVLSCVNNLGGYINCKSDPTMCFTNTISLYAVFRIGECNDGIGLGESVIFSKANNGFSIEQFTIGRWKSADGHNNKFLFEYTSPSGPELYLTDTQLFASQTNMWHSVALSFTYGASAVVKLYWDGVLQAGTWQVGLGTRVGLTNSQPATISLGGIGSSTTWQGEISEVAIWNGIIANGQMGVLTKSNVKRMPLQIHPELLVGYWALDESPAMQTLNTSTNRFKNLSYNRNQSQGTASGTAMSYGENHLSYPPNQ